MEEKLFRGVDYGGQPLFFFDDARFEGYSIDVLVSDEILSMHEVHYEIEAGRSGNPLPPVQIVANEVLSSIIRYAWRESIPSDIVQLISGKKTVAVSAHGNSFPILGWGLHVAEEVVVPLTEVTERLFSVGYDSIIFGVCNPERERLATADGNIIYPLGNFGPGDYFEMVYVTSTKENL